MLNPMPRDLLATLLPQLKLAATYAQQIQSRIVAQPAKDSENLFAAALSDADLSIQTFVEVTLLSMFPNCRFYGEEYEKTYNTKYFRSITLEPQGDYLITLDPIDGTRFYLDGHPNYQVILTVLNADDFEAAIALSPAQDRYYYALRHQGAFVGNFEDALEDCQPLSIPHPQPAILLGTRMSHVATLLRPHFQVIDVNTDYSTTVPIPNVNGLLTGDLTGALLAVGKFIDGAALAFIAREAGYIVTTHTGAALPPLSACDNYQWPGLAIASSPEVHQVLVECASQARDGMGETRGYKK